MQYKKHKSIIFLLISFFLLIPSIWAEEYIKYDSIIVTGTKIIEPSVIKKKIKAITKNNIVRLKDLDYLIKNLYKKGYYKDIIVELQEKNNKKILFIRLKEKPRIGKVIITGNRELDKDEIKKVVESKSGNLFDKGMMLRDRAKILNLYEENGFALAEVDVDTKKNKNNTIDVIFRIREGGYPIVKRIEFVGLKDIDPEELKSILEVRELGPFNILTKSGRFSKEALNRDAQRLLLYFYDHGYINAKVEEPVVTYSRGKKYIFIFFKVHQGKKFYFGRTTFSGKILFPLKELTAFVDYKTGEVFSRSRLIKVMDRVANRFKDIGYAYVNVIPETRVSAKKRRIDVNLRIEPGTKVLIERIEIKGNEKTRDKIIRREMTIMEGDYYSQKKIEESKARIYALGFFDKVDVTTRPGTTDHLVILTVTVKERFTGAFQLTFGYQSYEKFIFQAQFYQDNLFGRGQYFNLSAQLSSLQQLYSLDFYDRYFLDSNWSFGFNLHNTERNQIYFIRKAKGGSLSWGYFLSRRENLEISLTYSFDILDVQSSTGGIRLKSLLTEGDLGSSKFLIRWDRRNNRFFPTKGFYQSFSVDWASSLFGSDIEYIQYIFNSRLYIPLIWRLTYKQNLLLGYISSPSKEGLPVSERFFLGGLSTLRGFDFYSVGPEVKVLYNGNDPTSATSFFTVGGNKEFLLNMELEFPLVDKAGLFGVVFLDMGNVYAEDQNFFDRDENTGFILMMNTGFGIRWFSPMGPLRFEWGFPLTKRPQDKSPVFQFGIGTPF